MKNAFTFLIILCGFLFTSQARAIPWVEICNGVETGKDEWKKQYTANKTLLNLFCTSGCNHFSCSKACVQEACRQICQPGEIGDCLQVSAKGDIPKTEPAPTPTQAPAKEEPKPSGTPQEKE